jgi:single-stranded DNA-specific DHH superfamily exonuclease
MNVSPALIVVRKPNEPSEEYQEQMTVAKTSEYKNKLQDIEYKDAPKVNAEDFHSTQANMSLLKELLKDREVNKDQPKEKENAQSKEEQGSPSPIKAAHKGPVKGNPNPKGK